MADADQDEGEGDRIPDLAAASGAGSSFFRRMVPWLAGGVVSIGLGAGAGIVQNRRDEAKTGDAKDTKQQAPAPEQFPVDLKLDLGNTIFNCADTGQIISGAVTILLEVRTDEKWGSGERPRLKDVIDPKSEGEFSYAGRINDALVTLLTTKQSADLRSARGKEVLKLEILDQMNRILFGGLDKSKDPQGVVTSVLFTKFLVQ